jgi:hypothetical protein
VFGRSLHRIKSLGLTSGYKLPSDSASVPCVSPQKITWSRVFIAAVLEALTAPTKNCLVFLLFLGFGIGFDPW